jgi:hypothetical protein
MLAVLSRKKQSLQLGARQSDLIIEVVHMKKLIAVVVAFLSVSAPAIALAANNNNPPKKPPPVVVPEIDVTAGAKGIAVLIAGLLLVAEGLRRRR